MRIEPARTDDIADYVAIAAAAESMLRARGLAQWVPAAHAAYRNTIVAQQADGSLFAVYDGSAPIAFCVVTLAKSPWWPPDDVAALYLSGIVVSRSARGRAVGHTIVAWAIARAESLGLGAVRLDCHSGSTWLRRYYEDLGFVLRGLVEQHPGYDGCLYELRCGGDTGTLDLIPTVVPQLRGVGLVLREMTEADLAPWFARLSDPEAATLAGDPVATSMQAAVDGLA
jgi:RimJ/RimL family protein N-acetyltransferase